MIPPRNMITPDDIKAVATFLELGGPLSGYLAGKPYGGAAVQRLEELWCTRFKRKHAICCNSATSGLLAACYATGVEKDITVNVPALSMSATAAVPLFLSGTLHFLDADDFGCADWLDSTEYGIDIVTTLFGCPIDKHWMRDGSILILDNAQGILSSYDENYDSDDVLYSENVATITVTSFNVHKQINAGEMGIISTDDDHLNEVMRHFINHGECAGDAYDRQLVGLNLRPTEISAVLALSQMARIDDTIGGLHDLAHAITEIMPSAFVPFGVRDGCTSAHYCYPFIAPAEKRYAILNFLNAEGVPAIPMYQPLYRLPAFEKFARDCPIADDMAKGGILLELCSWRFEDDLASVARALEKASLL